MAKTFTTLVSMEQYMNKMITIAIENTCNIALGKLQELIMTEFYDAYDNQTYVRTFQFYNSAMTKMLSKTMGMIYMDASAMDYPWNGSGWSWSGELQLEAANQGSHGGWSTEESKQHRYWESFDIWCDENIIKILKSELNKVLK